MQSLTREEQQVIETIRERAFQNITVHINDGKIVLIRREETIKPQENAKK